jgi:hypothetical protein
MRVWFDQWLIALRRKRGLPVVDLTILLQLFISLHDYSHVAGEGVGLWRVELMRILPTTASVATRTDLERHHLLTREGRIRRVFFRKEIFAMQNFLWDVLVRKTHSVRKRLGLIRGARA